MALEVDAVTGRLAPGRHEATLRDIEQLFVVDAPFQKQREAIFAAFGLWIDQMRLAVPSIRLLWVDGGFVTHKDWAPADIDVVALHPPLTKEPIDRLRLLPLLTTVGPHRVQPMGGLVDAFLTTLAPADSEYWDRSWSAVYDEDKQLIPGISKGYVEVKVQ